MWDVVGANARYRLCRCAFSLFVVMTVLNLLVIYSRLIVAVARTCGAVMSMLAIDVETQCALNIAKDPKILYIQNCQECIIGRPKEKTCSTLACSGHNWMGALEFCIFHNRHRAVNDWFTCSSTSVCDSFSSNATAISSSVLIGCHGQ